MPNWPRKSDGCALDEMTINVGLVTSDAVVLGCDSIASTTNYYLDPFRLEWAKGPDKKIKKTPDGKYSLDFGLGDLESIVTNAWGGVTKLFEIHPAPSPVVAVTAGLAKLKNRPIASWAGEFYADQAKRTQKLVKVDVIAKNFLGFIRQKYQEHYKDSELPPTLQTGPEFLVGGFGRDDEFPCLYRLDVQKNAVIKELAGGGGTAGHTGVAWNGQSDAVERFIRGYDGEVKTLINSTISEKLTTHNKDVAQYITSTVNQILDKLGQKMPADINIDIPQLAEIKLDWEKFSVDLDYANLPIQEAINFVAFLVLLQDGKSRFARGVPTVGGRTHIGVITKLKGFQLLNEPELTHQYTGFADDR